MDTVNAGSMIPNGIERSDRRAGYQTGLAIAVIAALVAGNLPILHWFLFPLRLFITFIHEGCHGLVALATGGHVQRILIDSGGSGVTA